MLLDGKIYGFAIIWKPVCYIGAFLSWAECGKIGQSRLAVLLILLGWGAVFQALIEESTIKSQSSINLKEEQKYQYRKIKKK